MPILTFFVPFVLFLSLLAPGLTRSVSHDHATRDEYVSTDTTRPLVQAERDSVINLLETLDQEPFQSAFSNLRGHGYSRYSRTEQIGEDDAMIAFIEQVARIDSTGFGVVLASDSSGQFNLGFFDRFVSHDVESLDPMDLAAFLLPEDPPYLSSRKQDRFSYRFLPDTLLWDTEAAIIEIKALPDVGDNENYRIVRLFVEKQGQTLLAIYIERIDVALLFREESDYFTQIRKTGDGDWVPYNTRYHTRIRTPFRKSRQFRTVATYYDFD